MTVRHRSAASRSGTPSREQALGYREQVSLNDYTFQDFEK
jgi:hypothetical protein